MTFTDAVFETAEPASGTGEAGAVSAAAPGVTSDAEPATGSTTVAVSGHMCLMG
ncbi:hypothetical protein [Haloechinothrix salitolerans]|uniref:Uncharacterized protein n=1 Tax=Haloechinothrix salitolerans TaxID=926830 RepID=A0ABW2BVF7_9PSEU